MDQAEMTVRKSSIFMGRASLNQDLVREAVSWAAVSSLVKPTNSQINLRNQKVSVHKIKRIIRICETAWNAIAEDFLHFGAAYSESSIRQPHLKNKNKTEISEQHNCCRDDDVSMETTNTAIRYRLERHLNRRRFGGCPSCPVFSSVDKKVVAP